MAKSRDLDALLRSVEQQKTAVTETAATVQPSTIRDEIPPPVVDRDGVDVTDGRPPAKAPAVSPRRRPNSQQSSNGKPPAAATPGRKVSRGYAVSVECWDKLHQAWLRTQPRADKGSLLVHILLQTEHQLTDELRRRTVPPETTASRFAPRPAITLGQTGQQHPNPPKLLQVKLFEKDVLALTALKEETGAPSYAALIETAIRLWQPS